MRANRSLWVRRGAERHREEDGDTNRHLPARYATGSSRGSQGRAGGATSTKCPGPEGAGALLPPVAVCLTGMALL